MAKLSKKFWFFLAFAGAVSLLLHFALLAWVDKTSKEQLDEVGVLSRNYSKQFSMPPSEVMKMLGEFGETHRDVGYIFFSNFSGHTQSRSMWQKEERLKSFSNFSPSFEKEPEREDKEYIHEVSALFLPADASPDKTPLAAIKIAYVLPGKLGPSIRLGQGYRHLLSLWMLLSGVVIFFVAINDVGRGKKKSRSISTTMIADPLKTEESELTWLEDETGKTEPIFVDDQGRSWKIILDRDSTYGWSIKGNWYVNDAQLYGRPWAGSAVRQTFVATDRYHFQLRANKMAGPDGFVVLFPCGMMDLIWVLGGWGNTRTEILGYPSTSNGFKIRKNEWYFLEVRLTASHVEGYINGEFNFKIPKSEIKHPSPNVGFQKGLGVAVWSTLAKFSDIRLLES